MKLKGLVFVLLLFLSGLANAQDIPDSVTHKLDSLSQTGLNMADSSMRNKLSLEQMVGQMIMIGIGDMTEFDMTEPILWEIKQGQVGGVVIYEKNISSEQSKVKLKKLVSTLQDKSKIPLFVGIDEEGGKVTRLKEKYGFPTTVSARYLGQLDNLDSTRYYAVQNAELLSGFGINMNYAPCLDLNINPNNPVIGKLGRSYAKDEVTVVRHATTVIQEYHNRNILTVVKHFPGHGSSSTDTHLDITDVSDSWSINEIFPYSSLIESKQIGSIMTAHIINEHLDAQKKPATLSKNVIQGLLRGVLGFDGVVISDDMQMHAISKHYGFESSVVMCINAGVDILMFANNVPGADQVSARELHELIMKNILSGQILKERIEESFGRIMTLKQRWLTVHHKE